jgi:hypothetical protein
MAGPEGLQYVAGSIRHPIGVHTQTGTVTPPAAGIPTSSLSLGILRAEDNLVNQTVALGKMEHQITLSTNGLEALEQ